MARRAGQNDVTGRIRPAGRRLPDGAVLLQMRQTEQQLQQQMLQLMLQQQQLQAQVMLLSSQQSEMAHPLRAVHVARPIYEPANRPSHRGGLCFFCKHKGYVIRDCPRKRELDDIQSQNRCDAKKHVKELQ